MRIEVSGHQGLAEAGALREQLLDALGAGAEVVLDCGALRSADFAFVQLVESARRHAQRTGAALALAAPVPDALAAAATLSGLRALPGADLFWAGSAAAPSATPGDLAA